VIFVQSQVSNVSTISGREQITFQQQQQTKQNKHKIPKHFKVIWLSNILTD
jgi:hypothetical protein